MLEKLKAYCLPFLAGCAVTSASFLLMSSREVVKTVKAEEHTQIKQEVAKQSVEIKAVETHETKGRVVTLQKRTSMRPDGSKTVFEKKTIEEPVVKDSKVASVDESEKLEHTDLEQSKKSESVEISKPSLSRYSLGLQAPPLDVAKGDLKQARVEAGVRIGNLPVWGTVSSDMKLNVSVGLRVEF